MATKNEKINLTKSLDDLNKIVQWFEKQENVDVEVGLEKVREAANLIKVSKGRLTEIENEFKEIEREIGDDDSKDDTSENFGKPSNSKTNIDTVEGLTEGINPEDIPF